MVLIFVFEELFIVLYNIQNLALFVFLTLYLRRLKLLSTLIDCSVFVFEILCLNTFSAYQPAIQT